MAALEAGQTGGINLPFEPRVIEGGRDLALDPAAANRLADARRRQITDALATRRVSDEVVWPHVQVYLEEQLRQLGSSFATEVVSPFATHVPIGNLIREYLMGRKEDDEQGFLLGRRAVHLDMIDINRQGIDRALKVEQLKAAAAQLRPIHAALDAYLEANRDPDSRRIQLAAYRTAQLLIVDAPQAVRGYRTIMGVHDAKVIWTPSQSATQRR